MRMLLPALGAALMLSAAPGLAQREGPQPHDYALLSEDPESGAEMIGRPAPPWSFDRWLRTPALSPERLRGKVVLLRWWTEGCPYCTATLPGLETLRRRYERNGLVVIGVYHPKPPRRVGDREILTAADRLGFPGPIAVDERWITLKRYWLDASPERDWTSVSFLIDKAGLVRWVHGGGEYHPSRDPRHAHCDAEYHGLERMIAKAIAEPAPREAGR